MPRARTVAISGGALFAAGLGLFVYVMGFDEPYPGASGAGMAGLPAAMMVLAAMAAMALGALVALAALAIYLWRRRRNPTRPG